MKRMTLILLCVHMLGCGGLNPFSCEKGFTDVDKNQLSEYILSQYNRELSLLSPYHSPNDPLFDPNLIDISKMEAKAKELEQYMTPCFQDVKISCNEIKPVYLILVEQCDWAAQEWIREQFSN